MRIAENQNLVLGPPGTGKTTHVLNEIESLLDKGEDPDRIAFVSFTRKAIGEAVDRACTKFSLPKSRLPLFKTIHALCFAGLGISKKDVMGKEHYRDLGDDLGYAFDGTWDESEGVPVGSAKGDTLLFMDNLARITQRPLRDIWEDNYTECDWDELEDFQDKYQSYKSANFVMDFTDMLYAYVAMCDPSGANYVFVDEAQDLSAAQWMVLKHAFGNVRRATIAGDDDQSIYKWSGADVRAFLALEGDKRVLEQSYRLPSSVHEFSQNIVSKIENRFDKKFHARKAEGEIDIVGYIDNIEVDPDQSTMFLIRNTYLSQRIQERLELLGIPYVGRSGYSSIRGGHVRAINATEKLRKGEPITGKEVKELYDALRVGYYLKHGFKTKAQLLSDTDLFTFQELNQNWGLKDLGHWGSMLEGLPERTMAYYKAVGANGYSLTHAPKCSISTIHSAKGGEADHVVLLSDMAYRSFQEYEKSPDDERRVAYVGVTRAKEKLTIVESQSKTYFPYAQEGEY